jgi:hypothetical protein
MATLFKKLLLDAFFAVLITARNSITIVLYRIVDQKLLAMTTPP